MRQMNINEPEKPVAAPRQKSGYGQWNPPSSPPKPNRRTTSSQQLNDFVRYATFELMPEKNPFNRRCGLRSSPTATFTGLDDFCKRASVIRHQEAETCGDVCACIKNQVI